MSFPTAGLHTGPVEGGSRRPYAADTISETLSSTQSSGTASLGGLRMEPVHLGSMKESSAWDVYNNEAMKVDNELVKDWKENLNSLLLFTAIFAAVLTPFVIESKRMLQQDSTDTLLILTRANINNAGNLSNLPFTPPNFTPDDIAVSINCLLFASLGVTLSTAFTSVIALQWVADYDAAITRRGYSSEDWAMRRQFRFGGIDRWKMGEIIVILPMLLQISFVLFSAGISQWMYAIHPVVGRVVLGSTALSIVFYLVTMILAAFHPSVPFRTPLSRAIYWLWQLALALHFWSFFFISITVALIIIFGLRFRESLESIIYGGMCIVLSTLAACLTFLGPFRHPEGIFSGKFGFIPPSIARMREERAFGINTRLRQQSLRWLAGQLPISTDYPRRLLLLISGVIGLPPTTVFRKDFYNAPWGPILNSLAGTYMHNILESSLPEDDYEAVEILLRCSNVPPIMDSIAPQKVHYEEDSAKYWYWRQYCFQSGNGVEGQRTDRINMAFLLARDVPIPSVGHKDEIEATLQLIRWRNTPSIRSVGAWTEVFANAALYSPQYLESCTQCFVRAIPALRKRKDRFFSDLTMEAFQTGEMGYEQAVETLSAFDNCMSLGIDPHFHANVIQFMCTDLVRSNRHPPRWAACSEEVTNQLENLRDPCLAFIGAWMCGILSPTKIAMKHAYTREYFASVDILLELLCERQSLSDPLSVWQLRITSLFYLRRELATDSSHQLSTRKLAIFQWAFKKPEVLEYLYTQFSVSCQGQDSGAHHLLFRLYEYIESQAHGSIKVPSQDATYASKAGPNLILVLLAQPNFADPQCLVPDHFDQQCVQRILDICGRAKKEPPTILALLVDILSLDSHRTFGLDSASLIIEIMEQAMVLPDSPMTRILTPSLILLLQQDQKELPDDDRFDAGGRQQALRIRSSRMRNIIRRRVFPVFLYGNLICSRMTNRYQSARTWLPMYID